MKKNVKKMKQNLEAVKEYLTQQGLQFFCDEEAGLIAAGFTDAFITFRVSDELIELQVRNGREVPEEAYPEVMNYLNKVNRLLKEGHFEVKPEQGVSYRIASGIGKGTTLRNYRLKKMIEMASYVGAWFAGSYRIVDEELTAEEAFEQTWAELLW